MERNANNEQPCFLYSLVTARHPQWLPIFDLKIPGRRPGVWEFVKMGETVKAKF